MYGRLGGNSRSVDLQDRSHDADRGGGHDDASLALEAVLN